MAMTEDYLDAIADAGAALITHIGLVDESGEELTGGDPAYARQAVSWTAADGGVIRPEADLEFDVPPNSTVAGWRAYSASSEGDDFGGSDLTPEAYAEQGVYTLLAASTGVRHKSAAEEEEEEE